MTRDKPGPDTREVLNSLLGRSPAAQLDTLEQVQIALAQAAAAVQDAHDERDHWRKKFGTVQTEMVMLASVLLKRMGRDGKISVKAAEFKEMANQYELVTENPQPGIRMYALRRKVEDIN